jgi:hypothetical protein
MRLKFIICLITAILFNALTSGVVAGVLDVSHPLAFGIQMGLSAIPLNASGCLLDGLNKEIWIPDIIEKFYPETHFLTHSKDLSPWVDNNKLNLQEAGIDPKVYIDNEEYPIPIAARTDIPHEIMLKRFDTENTVHVNAVEIEESAQKRQSVIEGHRNSLRQKFAALAAFNWAPAHDGDFTPVSASSGAANLRGYKALRFEDILDMEVRFDELEVPPEDRILVIHPLHITDLRRQDMNMFKAVFSENRLFTFTLSRSSLNPRYNGAAGVKLPWNAPVSATDAPASLAYYKNAVARAQGTVDMYSRLGDPEYRGDIIGFNMRGVATPITGKHIGAIYSPKA